MKYIIAIAGFVVMLSGTAFADTPCTKDCVTKVVTDFSGRPPFKRRIEVLSIADVAQLELVKTEAPEGKLVKVRKTDFRGRPPFKRRTETLIVADVAQAELVDESAQTKVRRRAKIGNSAFKRH